MVSSPLTRLFGEHRCQAVHPEIVGGGCRAATTPPAFSGRNWEHPMGWGMGGFDAPLDAALLVAARRVPPASLLQHLRDAPATMGRTALKEEIKREVLAAQNGINTVR